MFVVIPWCDVDGVYWQNHDAGGPNCFMSWILSCMFPFVFGCCCCVCSGAAENKETYFNSSLGGHKGCQVSICPRNSKSFRLGIGKRIFPRRLCCFYLMCCGGIAIPNRFYGMNDKQVNALVDSISYRSVRNIPLARVVGVLAEASPAPMPQQQVSVLSDAQSSTAMPQSVAADSDISKSNPPVITTVAVTAPTFAVSAVQQSIHHAQYVSPNKHNGDPRTMQRPGFNLHFPIGNRVRLS